jgi:hypothetical protein
MYMRAVTFRIVYVGIVSVGILLSAAFRQSTVQAAPATTAAAQRSPAVAAPRIVTLPTVQVTAVATRATVAPKAPAVTKAVAGESRDAGASGSFHTGSAPSLRLDMPYYSFGKALPRVGKE